MTKYTKRAVLRNVHIHVHLIIKGGLNQHR